VSAEDEGDREASAAVGERAANDEVDREATPGGETNGGQHVISVDDVGSRYGGRKRRSAFAKARQRIAKEI